MWTKWVKTLMVSAILFCGVILFSSQASAVPANNNKMLFKQPNGVSFYATLRGDEWANWAESSSGDVLVRANDGYWCYAQYTSGKLEATSSRYMVGRKPANAVSKNDIENIVKQGKGSLFQEPKNVKLQPAITNKIVVEKYKERVNDKFEQQAAATEPMLIIRIDYNDIQSNFKTSDFTNLFFNPDTKSVNKYYKDASAGVLQFSPIPEENGVVNDGIVTVKLNQNHPDTADKSDSVVITKLWPTLKAALSEADKYVDFSTYDANGDGYIERNELHVVFVSAGWEFAAGAVGGPSIWAHSWALQDDRNANGVGTDYRFESLDGVYVCSYDEVGGKVHNGGYTVQSEIHVDHLMGMGTVTHELGHDIGLPDEYDYGYDSQGVGIHSLMASGSWAAAPGGYAGTSPTYIDAFSKFLLGYGNIELADENKSYNVKSANTGEGNVLVIPANGLPEFVSGQYFPKELFLVENRQYKGFDESLKTYTKSPGLLIEHVDMDVYFRSEIEGFRMNDDQNHKAVDVEEANEGKLGYSQLDYNVSEDMVKYDHYFYSGGNTKFNSKTIPSSNTYSGDKTIDISVGSKPADTMTIKLGCLDYDYPEIVGITPNLQSLDPTEPTILSTNPTKIVIKFNEPIKPVTFGQVNSLGWIYIRDMEKGVVIPAEATFSGPNLTLTLQQKLEPAVLYRIRIGDMSVVDMAGNPFLVPPGMGDGTGALALFFTVKDTTGPKVVSSDPAAKATAVSVDSTINVTFDEGIIKGAKFDQIALKDAAGHLVTISVEKTAYNVLTIIPEDNLAEVTKYTLTIPKGAVVDRSEFESANFTLNFTTGEPNPPVIVKTTPADKAVDVIDKAITIEFNENIAIVDKNLITLKDSQDCNVVVNITAFKNKLTITPKPGLKTGTYTLTISDEAVKDLFGNLFDGPFTITFTVK